MITYSNRLLKEMDMVTVVLLVVGWNWARHCTWIVWLWPARCHHCWDHHRCCHHCWDHHHCHHFWEHHHRCHHYRDYHSCHHYWDRHHCHHCWHHHCCHQECLGQRIFHENDMIEIVVTYWRAARPIRHKAMWDVRDHTGGWISSWWSNLWK